MPYGGFGSGGYAGGGGFSGGGLGGFRPPQGSHLNALQQRRPMNNLGALAPQVNQMPQVNQINQPGPNSFGSQPVPNAGAPMGPPTSFNGPAQMMGQQGSEANDPGGHMFMSLPQGTEELFGAAGQGFSQSLRKGGYKGSLPSLGGGGMGMF